VVYHADAALLKPLFELGLSEADLAAWEANRGELVAADPAQHGLDRHVELLGDDPGGQQTRHGPDRPQSGATDGVGRLPKA